MEVLPGLHVFKIPLPGNPLKHVNCYLIEDNPPLLIDAGMNMEACYSAAKVIVERFGRPRPPRSGGENWEGGADGRARC